MTRLASWFQQVDARPWAHDFYQLMRLVDALRPDAPRLGSSERAADDALRLGQDAELDFAPSAISSWSDRRDIPRLGVRFFGLFGPQGALPTHLTEFARERERHRGDPTFARFADVFHHRMLSLFYRAWAQAQPTVDLDRPAQARFPRWLGAIAGIDAGSLTGADSLDALAKARQAGLLARNVKNAESVERVLGTHFGWPVQIEPYSGHWLRLRDADRTRLGGAGLGQQLGRGAVAGRKVWDRQYRFTVRVGPLSLDQYQTLLPTRDPVTGEPAARPLTQLRDWVRHTVGRDLGWQLRPTLAADQVPSARLGRHTRLGWNGWLLGGRPSARDRSDLTIDPERMLSSAARATCAPSAPCGPSPNGVAR